ncbi:hypothetical protein OROGR_008714 [Orobanche gracilis]
MDAKNGLVHDLRVVGQQPNYVDASEVESLNQRVDEIFTEVDQIEQKLIEVEQFYSNSNVKHLNASKSGSIVKDKDKEKIFANFFKRQRDASRREADAAKRRQDLMRQFENILLKMTQLKWATPFMQPVDVVGLGLHDYYEVIEKPMDFSTIISKMEARDGTGYKNVREISADVRLIFKNAMKYNDEKDDVHVMAKSLLDKFETKWLQLLPKVDEDEKLRREEEAEMQLDMQLAREVAHAKTARDLSSELDKVEMNLEELKELALQKCRSGSIAYIFGVAGYGDPICACTVKMTTEEKKRLGSAITRLPPHDIDKALEIIAQNDPTFQAAGETVEVDIDAQSEYTLWKLKLFVKDALQQAQMKSSPKPGGHHHNNNNGDNNQNGNNRRKRELGDPIVSNPQKKSRKLPT